MASGYLSACAIVADFTGDGVNDLIAASPWGLRLGLIPGSRTNESGFELDLWRGQQLDNAPGGDVFKYTTTEIVSVYFCVADDVDQDGDMDLIAGIVGRLTSSQPSGEYTSRLSIFANQGDGDFETERPLQIGALPVLALADLNTDGVRDLIILNLVHSSGFTLGTLGWLRGLGAGSYAAADMYAPGENPFKDFVAKFNDPESATRTHLFVADFTGDGVLDFSIWWAMPSALVDFGAVLVVGASGGGFASHRNFTEKTSRVRDLLFLFTGASTGDFWGNDGANEVIAFGDTTASGAGHSPIVFFVNNGTGGFSFVDIRTDIFYIFQARALDFNRDGIVDIVFSKYAVPASAAIILGRGNATHPDLTGTIQFLEPSSKNSAVGVEGIGVVVGDFQSDSDLDVYALFGGGGPPEIYITQGCPPLGHAPHATISSTGTGEAVGVTRTYVCNAGYVLVDGSSLGPRVCLADATWTGVPANCTADRACSAISALTVVSLPPNATVTAGAVASSLVVEMTGWCAELPATPVLLLVAAAAFDGSTPDVLLPLTLLSGPRFAPPLSGARALYAFAFVAPLHAAAAQVFVLNASTASGGPRLALFTLRVQPARADATTSLLLAPAGNAVLGTPIRATVVVRDVFGNDRARSDAIDFELSRGAENFNNLIASYEPESGAVNLALVESGLYQLSMSIDSVPGPVAFVSAVIVCPPGSRFNAAATSLAAGACVECLEDTFANVSSASLCLACPAATSTWGARGAQTLGNCSCAINHFDADAVVVVGGGDGVVPDVSEASLIARVSRCLPCPAGASCAGHAARPISLPGYAPIRPDSSAFGACPRPERCLAGSRCVSGSTGYLCKDCASGFVATSTVGRCSACPAQAKSVLGLYVAFVLLCAIVSVAIAAFSARSLLVVQQLSTSVRHHATSKQPTTRQAAEIGSTSATHALWAKLRSRTIPPTIAMALSALQVVGVIGLVPVRWPALAERALTVFNVFSLDASIFANECTLSSFAHTYTVAMLSPLVFVAVLLLSASALRFGCGNDAVPVRVVVISAITQFSPLAYLPLSRSTLKLFNCRALPGTSASYLEIALEFRCFGPEWYSLLPLGMAGLVLYVIGIPLIMTVMLTRWRNQLFSNPRTVVLTGSLYKLYRQGYYMTIIAQLGKRLFIAAVSIFVTRYPSLLMALLGLCIGCAAVLQARANPFYFALYDRFDLVASGALGVLCLAGISLGQTAGSSAAESPDTSDDSAVRRICTALVLAAVATLCASIVAFVLADIRQILADRRQRDSHGDFPSAASFATRARRTAAALLRDVSAVELSTLASAHADSEASVDTRADDLAVGAIARDCSNGDSLASLELAGSAGQHAKCSAIGSSSGSSSIGTSTGEYSSSRSTDHSTESAVGSSYRSV